MLLIQVREWFGPTRQCPEDVRETAHRYERVQGYVTEWELGHAIMELKRYSIEFTKKHPYSAVEHSILSVCEIPTLTSIERNTGDLFMIENLIKTLED